MRLVNLTVLPTGTALAVIAPTALEAVYGPSLLAGAIPFAILAITIIFSAQSLLLITTLQAIGKTKPILGISVAATAIDLIAVGLGARPLGTTAGAIGRALLALGTMTLAWWTLRRILHVPLTHGLPKALLVAILTAAPLAIADYALATNLHLIPLFRLPVLVIVFGLCFLIVSRELSVFTDVDFELFENALPRALGPYLDIIERLMGIEQQNHDREDRNTKAGFRVWTQTLPLDSLSSPTLDFLLTYILGLVRQLQSQRIRGFGLCFHASWAIRFVSVGS